MNKIMISPSRYVQGADAIADLGKHVAPLGTKALVLGGKRGLGAIENLLSASLKEQQMDYTIEYFGGECSRPEIDRIVSVIKQNNLNIIIGVGGGKALDTAKAAAYTAKIPVAIVPTIATTDAPCSALSVIYTPEGVFDSYLVLPKNPDLVLVDTAIIAQAPARLFVSGMGDALATWFEADACAKAFAGNLPGGLSTAAALCLAKLCYDILMEYGFRAKLALEQGVATEAVEKVVEANTLLSGLGFESSGLAAAHAVHNGFTVLEETHQAYHGEKVSFGTLVQLVLENRTTAEIEKVLSFCKSVGLPITLKQIGISEVTPDKIRKVAEATCAPGETIYNQPFSVNATSVYAAILAADAIGRAYLKQD
ncbi:glycerol dehydrogenase [Sporomusa acidovorans]|uniref:Glycerol dehydrogenase n=1 Tax=Sporomusa acidovorans (strain ATCC 49682 / DSM 3132 / Mol) TaxID=1123286 RepID=A0ABZ3J107_SPOA4|nr:glycerol dehydrogenase [Sporomusa acidovorans]OZC22819.1 glycerol dehydrogenase [Sporomusa acidovorans DSM 3132]SDE51990.1 glycerol 2-dehydrogenase (NAD+) [Sporomusa acidovorans]